MDEIVYKYYLGSNYKIGTVVCSPLPERVRPKDDKPSFSTKRYGDVIIWNDFGYRSEFGNGYLGLVCLMEEGINTKAAAREFVKTHILKGKPYVRKDSHTIQANFDRVGSIKTKLVFEYWYLGPEHIMYYERLFVSYYWLVFFKMYALKSIIKDDKAFWSETKENFGFYKKVGAGNKGYMPFNSFYHNRIPKVMHQGIDILEGYDELPGTGEMLIWAKSLKEVILLRSCGYYAVALSGENSFNIFNKFYWSLSIRFKIHLVWGDPDPAGKGMARYIKSRLPDAKIAQSRMAKDASDIVALTQTRFYVHLIIDYALNEKYPYI